MMVKDEATQQPETHINQKHVDTKSLSRKRRSGVYRVANLVFTISLVASLVSTGSCNRQANDKLKSGLNQLYRSILSNDIDDVRLKLRNQNIPDIQINKTIASRIFLKTYQSNSIQLAKFFIVEKQAALTQHFAKRMKKLYMKRHNRPGFEQKLEIVHLLESYTGIVAWRDQNLLCLNEPCQNDAQCLNSKDLSKYECICPAHFSGDLCEDELVCQSQKPCNPSQSFSCNELGYGEYECDCKHGYTGQNCDEAIQTVTQKTIVQKAIVTDEPVSSISTGSMESILAMVPDGRGLLDFYRVGDDLEFRKSMKMPYEVVGRPVIVFNGDYDTLELLGDMYSNSNTHHGWLDMKTGSWINIGEGSDISVDSYGYGRFEGRSKFVAVWTEKLGTLTIGGHKKHEEYTNCMKQVTLPRSLQNSDKNFLYMPNLWTGRSEMGVAYKDDKIYIVGGYDGYRVLNSVEVVDLSGYELGGKTELENNELAFDFVEMKPLESVVSRLTVQIIGNVLYAIGGFRSPNYAEKYDLTTQQSLGFTNNLNSQHLQAASCVNDKYSILVFAGFKSSRVVEKLEYGSSDWSKITETSDNYRDRFGRNMPQGMSYAQFDFMF